MIFRALSVLVAVMMFLMGARWIIDPAAAAQGLGMELLTGVGASTQIGDLGAFFLTTSVMIVLAQRAGQTHWFFPPAMLLGSAAVVRILAWATGNAALGTEFIVAESIMVGILVAAARTRSEERGVAGTAAS